MQTPTKSAAMRDCVHTQTPACPPTRTPPPIIDGDSSSFIDSDQMSFGSEGMFDLDFKEAFLLEWMKDDYEEKEVEDRERELIIRKLVMLPQEDNLEFAEDVTLQMWRDLEIEIQKKRGTSAEWATPYSLKPPQYEMDECSPVPDISSYVWLLF